ncbi:unnamed protein product [Cunninghamella echinulata]
MTYWIKTNEFQHRDKKWAKIIVIWLSTLFMICESVAINNNSSNSGLSLLGLPRGYHCALNYNNALYILGGQHTTAPSLSIHFNDILQMPSIQWINNSLSLQQQQQQQQQQASPLCTVTSYGEAILFDPTSLQESLLLDLNTFQWNNMSTIRRLVSTNVSSIFAVTIMENDHILLLSSDNNNNTTTSWILNASNDRLRWRLSQLSSSINNNNNSFAQSPSPSPPPPSINGGAHLIAASSWIYYFHIDTSSSSSGLYTVNVYGFDSSSLTWVGNLFNFTSATNDIQITLIDSNTDNNTLFIIPTSINTTNESNNNNNNNNQSMDSGYWLLTVSTNTTNSQINWHSLSSSSSSSSSPSNDNNPTFLKGGSITKILDTVVFYGGINITDPLAYSPSMFHFWNISDQTFLPTPSWLATLISSSSTPTPTSSSISNEDNDNNNTLVIILATLLGVFGTAFFVLIGVFLWFKNKKKKTSSTIRATEESPRQLRLEEGQDLMNTRHPHQEEEDEEHMEREKGEKIQSPRFSFLKKENATIWSNQLQRALSTAFNRKSMINQEDNNNNNNNNNNNDLKIKTQMNENNMLSKGIRKTTQLSPSNPSLLSPSTSQNKITTPSSNRNSMYETASVTSRFVEQI